MEAAFASPTAQPGSDEWQPHHAAPLVRLSALYCMPHIRLPGVLALAPRLVHFEPDMGHEHVQEFGSDQYLFQLEVRDVLACGAVVMPLEGCTCAGMDEIAYILQMRVRTLDGCSYLPAEDAENAWNVMFRMRSKQELHDAVNLLLDSMERAKAEAPRPRRSATSIPFSSLDCQSEVEALRQQHRREQLQAGRKPSQSIMDLDAFLSPARAEPREADDRPESPVVMDSVVMRPGGAGHTLLTRELAEALLEYLPINLRVPGSVEWVLRYTPKAHGVSIATLYRNLAAYEKSVLVVSDAEEHVFGGFAPAPWEQCHRFYGTGETFVFSCGRLCDPPELQVYPWTTRNGFFMYSDSDLLAMGGGDGHHALVIRSDLLHGCSSPTPTFGNPVLAGSEEFVVRDMEIWALEEPVD